MPELKHTPGPWRKSGYCAYGWDIRTDKIWIGTVHNDHNTTPDKSFPRTPVGEANAQAISAVPELIEAAEALIRWDDMEENLDVRKEDSDTYFFKCVDAYREARDKARAAIAKAKGENDATRKMR